MPPSVGSMLSGGVRKKRPHKYVCGVPSNKCSGSFTSASNGLKKGCKMHGSPQDAHKCYGRYLVSQGYVQVGPREYSSPNDGPIVVLTKKSRFGARCRGGKAERFMPEKMVGGHIVSI